MKYKKIRWIPPANFPPPWMRIASYAATNRMATDAVYLARLGSAGMERLQQMTKDALENGKFDADSLYVMDDAAFQRIATVADRDADLLVKIDGLNVLAPGWKKCRDCLRDGDNARSSVAGFMK